MCVSIVCLLVCSCVKVNEFIQFSRTTPQIDFYSYFTRQEAKWSCRIISKTPNIYLKGKFPKTTMWIGWVESNFTNPTVKVWADLDNPFKRSDYAKLCMSPSLDGTLPEYVISQEDNSPLTLYINFHNFSWISIVLLIKFIHKCMHIHLSPNIPKYKRRGKIHFHEK